MDNGRRKSTEMRPEIGQRVMVRQHHGGLYRVAWGKVVGGGPGKYQVMIEGSFPDVNGDKPYDEGEVVEFKRIDGFSVLAVRRVDR